MNILSLIGTKIEFGTKKTQVTILTTSAMTGEDSIA